MANPYTYGADGTYGQRWAAKQGTTTTRLNYARLMADYLRYALDQIMDTSAGDFGTWENPLTLGAIYMWGDATNEVVRVSTSAPSSETDGVALVTGGLA